MSEYDNLGIFQPNLYPTVGLQTPGEVVDANFGQEPFLFDIEDMMNELKTKTKMEIYNFPVPESQGEWQAILSKWVNYARFMQLN